MPKRKSVRVMGHSVRRRGRRVMIRGHARRKPRRRR